MTTTPSSAGKGMDAESRAKCPICGEIDPRPASICLAKLTGDAERGQPCQFSVEGQERTRAAIEAKAGDHRHALAEALAHGKMIRSQEHP